MALVAKLNADFFQGTAGGESVATGASNLGVGVILGVNGGFHIDAKRLNKYGGV